MKKILFQSLIGLFLFCSCAFGAEKPFGFAGMELYKSDSGVFGLRIHDMNNDGLQDIILINNSKAVIEIYLRLKSPAEEDPAAIGDDDVNKITYDSWFRKEECFTEKHIFCYTLGDFNSDGRTDIALYGDPREVAVFIQGSDGKWEQKDTFEVKDGKNVQWSICAADFNSDKKDDVALLCESDVKLFYQNEEGRLAPPDGFTLTDDVAGRVNSLMCGDFNNDGRSDLCMIPFESKYPLRMRLQQNNGKLGPEFFIRLQGIKFVDIFEFDNRPGFELFTLLRLSSRLKIYKLTREKTGLGYEFRHYPLSGGKADGRDVVSGPVRKGRGMDVLVTNPDSSQLSFYTHQKGQIVHHRDFPTLAGGGRMCLGNIAGDAKNEAVILSKKEKTLGYTAFTSEKFPFPKTITVPGEPLCFTLVPEAEGTHGIILAARHSEKGIRLLHLNHGDSAGNLQELAKFKSAPSALSIVYADSDSQPDLLVFYPYNDPELWLRRDGKYINAAEDGNVRKGMLKGLTPNSVYSVRGCGKGENRFFICADNYIRSLEWTVEKSLEVRFQINSIRKDARVVSCTFADLKKSGAPELVMLNETASKLEIYEKAANSNEYTWVFDADIPSYQLPVMCTRDFNSDGKDDLIIAGKRKFSLYLSDTPRFTTEELYSYETDLNNAVPYLVECGDMNADGKKDVILLEIRNKFLEVIELQGDSLKRRLAFKIFEKKHYQKQKDRFRADPREMVCADVTGDKQDDIVLLVHDKIIIYKQ